MFVLSQKACMCARALDSEDDVQNYVEPADLAPCAATLCAAGRARIEEIHSICPSRPIVQFFQPYEENSVR